MKDQASGRRSVAIAPLFAAIVLLATGAAQAAVDFDPQARVSAGHNSNVFQRPSDEPPFAANGNTQLGDTILRYLASLTTDIRWGLDNLALTVQGERFDYDHFKTLNHYESKFGGVLDWYLGPRINGSVEYSQHRSMAPLADTLSEALEIQTDKLASATVRYLLTPKWRIDLQPIWHEFETPLPQYPTFGDKETSVVGALKYLGIDKFTWGLREEYVDGRYHGIVNATRYQQTTTDLTADYAVSGFSSFNGQLGYTKRTNSFADPANVTPGASNGDTNAFTGSLGFRRNFSVKTSATLRVFREVDSYIAGANSQVGTGGEGTFQWKPDFRFTLFLRYRLVTQSFQGTGIFQGTTTLVNFNNRTDHERIGEVDLEYYPFKWLTVKPYYLVDDRHSNFHEANFNSSLVGIDLVAHLYDKPALKVPK